MRLREIVTTVFVGAVVLSAAGVVSVAGAEDGAAPATSAITTPPTTRPAPTTTSSTTTSTTTTSTTTTTAPPAPVVASLDPAAGPAPPPANPREKVPVVEIGRIRIPKVGLDHPVYEGVSLTVIDVGPGHWPGTPLPGGAGNVVFGGHRVTRSHPFRDLDQLAPGDLIEFALPDGSRPTYAVTEQFIVDPEAMWIVDPLPGQMLTLFACHPKGSARQRIVIRATLQTAGTASSA